LCPVAREILRYLTQHPKAQDTLEGISQWWLPERGMRVSVAETKAAVEQLVVDELLLAHRGLDGRIRYGRNPRKHPKPRDTSKGRTTKPAAGSKPRKPRTSARRKE
jgi:hypothetical protein